MTVAALDRHQRLAAEVESGKKQVVIAPAGCGKTETVAALVEHLVENEGLEASNEILVLSFSRAAITALRRRLASKSRAYRSVNVRTLDALASRILSEDEDAGEAGRTFDGRIRQATTALRRGFLSDELEAVTHLVVDEVQDVVGDRAKFVLEILKSISKNAGFTVLGDPQQAIYNFQLKDPRDMRSEQFLSAIDTMFAPVHIRLGTNYRAKSNDARQFASLGDELEALSANQRVVAVRSALANILPADDLHDMPRLLERWSGRTAFLCKTNGEAIIARDKLRSLGVAAALQGSADQRGAASWIAENVDGTRLKIERKDFVESWSEAIPLDAAAAWHLLKRAERNFSSGTTLSIRRLAYAVVVRDLPAELLEPTTADVVVSTVHRSKGLEFDNVVLVNAADWLPADATNDAASEAYVALTRARERVILAGVTRNRTLRRDARTGRLIIGGPAKFHTFGFEMRPADTRALDDPARSAPVQSYLRREVFIGDAVTPRINRILSTPETPYYELVHKGESIGITNEGFGTALARRLGPRRNGKSWPALSGVSVDGFETRGGGSETAHSDAADLWLGAVVTGMAKFDWNSEKR